MTKTTIRSLCFISIAPIAVLALTLSIAAPALVQAQGPAVTFDLQEYVDNLHATKPSYKIGVQVSNAADGKLLFADGADTKLIPASVLKLLTTFTALRLLGGNYRFPTEVFVDHLPKELGKPGAPQTDFSEPPLAVGNIYFRGYGDPGLNLARLRQLTDTLPRLGVKTVRDVIIDDSLFVNPPRASGDKPHEAGLSAVTINLNTYAVNIVPGPIGEDATLSINEPVTYELRNRVKTTRGSAFEIGILQNPGAAVSLAGGDDPLREFFSLPRKYTVTVQGVIGYQGSAQTFLRAAPDLGEYFAMLLRDCLLKSGVSVEGRFLRGEIPREARLIQISESEEVAALIREINHFSSNVMAGQLLFAMGQDTGGYFHYERGLERLRSALEQLGEAPDSFDILDGSGLDRGNRLKASQLVKILLGAEQDFSLGPDFIASLSRFGQSGTLKNRELLEPRYLETLRGEERESAKRRASAVWAKTGTLDGVSSLAGYAQLKTGERVAFAVLLNDVGQKDEAAKIEEDLMKILLGFPRDFVPAAVVPRREPNKEPSKERAAENGGEKSVP